MSNTMIRLKAAVLFGAVAVGFVAFGDYYKDWTATTDAYWEDDSSWSTGEGNITDYRIGNFGSVVKFRSAVEESDNITVLHYNGEHSFVADNATSGIKKPNAPLDVKAPWWYSGSPVLTIKNGTYQFASVNIWTDATYGGTPGLILAGGTLKTAYVAGSGGILTLNGGTLEFDSTEYDSDDWGIIGVPLTIGSSGGKIDTGSGENNYRLAVTSNLSGSGLITKTGARPLSFTGDASGFTGTITVAAGAGAVTVGETTIGPGETVSFESIDPAVYVWNDVGSSDFEDESNYLDLAEWSISGTWPQYERLERPGTNGQQHYLAYSAVAGGGGRSTTATYTIPSDLIERINSEGAYEIELDWFATVGYATKDTEKFNSFFKAYSGDMVVASIDAQAVFAGGKDGVDAKVYKYGEVATEATVHTASRGSDSYDANKSEYWYHVSLKATSNGVYLTVAKPDGTEVVSDLFVSDYVVLTKLVVQVQSRSSDDATVAGVDDIMINIPVFSTADGQNYIAAAGSMYGSEAEETIDVSAEASIIAGKTVVKVGEGSLVLTGLPTDDACDINVQEGTLILPSRTVAGDVDVSEDAHLSIDVTGETDGHVVFTYSSLTGDVSLRGFDNSAVIVTNTVGETTTWTLAREAKTYTWAGEDGGSWIDPSNWLVDEEVAASAPTADDNIVFEGSATVNIPSEYSSVGKVQVADGAILTINPGATFASVALGTDAKLAFDVTIGAVGDISRLAIISSGNVTISDIIIPANYSGSFSGGVLAAERVASTFTWAGTGTAWSQPSSWLVNDSVVRNIPAPEDFVVFPASDDGEFENWEVELTSDVYVGSITVNGNTLVSGGRTIKTTAINGTAELRLNNANLGSNGAVLDVYCPLNIMTNTTNYIYLQGYNVNLHGSLYGSGVLKADHAGVQNIGVKFYGDVSKFYGTFESSNYNNRDNTDFFESANGSTNAVWKISPSHNKSTESFVTRNSGTLYMFGALIGQLWAGNQSVQIQVGGRDDTDSSFTLNSHNQSTGYTNPFTITKIGASKMTINNGKDSKKIGTLYLNGGTTEIKDMPLNRIQFDGGYIRTPVYQTVIGTETTYTYENENDSEDKVVTKEYKGESYEENGILYVLKSSVSSDVIGDYYPDISSKITESKGAVAFENDAGENHVWEAAIDASNEGGFAKYGAGTLTLKEWDSDFEGVVTVWAGTLIVPDGTELVVNPLSAGEITYPNGGDPIKSYCYAPRTVLNGTETADDDLDKQLDVANVKKVDFSNPTEEMLADLCEDGIFVLAKTSDSSSRPVDGYKKDKIELDMLGEDYEWPAGVEKPKWWNESTKWTVRVLTVKENGKKYTALAVARGEFPFVISVQ